MGADFKWLERRENCEFHTQLGRETSKLFFSPILFHFFFHFIKKFFFFNFFFPFSLPFVFCLFVIIYNPILTTGSLMESRLIIKTIEEDDEDEESFVFRFCLFLSIWFSFCWSEKEILNLFIWFLSLLFDF